MRRFRAIYRTRGSRKAYSNNTYSRRKYRTTRVQRSNRIFRKFIRRTAIRPELKFSDLNYEGTVNANSVQNIRVSMSNMETGTAHYQRIGNQVNFVKVDLRMIVRNNSSTTSGSAPVEASFYHRIIIWSPRIDFNAASLAMTGMDFNDIIDHNAVTVYRDVMQILYPPYMQEDLTDATPAGNGRDKIFRKFSIKFPRKVKFGLGLTGLDEEKNSLYMTIKTQGAIAYNTQSRVWFFDA